MMTNNTVVFVGSPEKLCRKRNLFKTIKSLFIVSPFQIAQRIFASFVPPFGNKYSTIYIDFLGPLLGFVFLSALLVYGYSFRLKASYSNPVYVLLLYLILMPFYSYVLCKLSRADISLCEISSLVGYSLYGHIFTLGVSYLFYHETSNVFFFICMIIFEGLSTFRLAVILLKMIPLPAIRLIVCSSVAVVQILFLIFLHFAYMHRTFVYGGKTYVKM